MKTINIFRFLLFGSLGARIYSSTNEPAMVLAKSLKVLIHAIAKPCQITVLACWNLGNDLI